MFGIVGFSYWFNQLFWHPTMKPDNFQAQKCLIQMILPKNWILIFRKSINSRSYMPLTKQKNKNSSNNFY